MAQVFVGVEQTWSFLVGWQPGFRRMLNWYWSLEKDCWNYKAGVKVEQAGNTSALGMLMGGRVKVWSLVIIASWSGDTTTGAVMPPRNVDLVWVCCSSGFRSRMELSVSPDSGSSSSSLSGAGISANIRLVCAFGAFFCKYTDFKCFHLILDNIRRHKFYNFSYSHNTLDMCQMLASNRYIFPSFYMDACLP